MRYATYAHCAGDVRVPKRIQAQIQEAIGSVEARYTKGAVREMRSALVSKLKEAGWSANVDVARGSDMTITAIQDRIGLCLQTGNMARYYADLIKLQTLYLDNVIDAAVMIVPAQPLALALGSNIAHAQRVERELEIFRKAYHVPTLLFSLE